MKTSISLPADLVKRIKDFNNSNPERPINVSGTCKAALEKELDKAIVGSWRKNKRSDAIDHA